MTPPPTPTVTRRAPGPSTQRIWSSTELQLLDAHNAERRQAGRRPLVPTNALGRLAGRRCTESIQEWKPGGADVHDGFPQALKESGIAYTYAGENAAYGQPTVASVFGAGWSRRAIARTSSSVAMTRPGWRPA